MYDYDIDHELGKITYMGENGEILEYTWDMHQQMLRIERILGWFFCCVGFSVWLLMMYFFT